VIRLLDFFAANPEAQVAGRLFAEVFDAFAFDSRIVQPGQLFVAYKTTTGDGHDHVDAACRGGAAGVVCQRPMAVASYGVTCVVVPDCQAAMEAYAAWIVRSLDLPIVGITGSVGKTTAKEMVAHVLAGRRRVFRSPKNFNGYFGLPIALGYLTPDVELAVLEMGIDRFGEMAAMTALAPPTVALVTRVAAAHLARFGTLAGVAQEKGMLVEALPPDGLAVLNADDPLVAEMASRSPAPVLTYGTAPHADFRVTDIRLTPSGTAFRVSVRGQSVPVRVPWLGEHFAGTAAAAMAIGERFGLPAEEVAERLASLPRVAGRLNPLPGLSGSLLVDDSYNASPAAVEAGLGVLAQLPAQRRIAVLGDMAELGDTSEALHRSMGQLAADSVDVLVTKGKDAAAIAEGARAAGLEPARVHITYTADDAVAAVLPYLAPGSVVLVKGSAVARMEQVVAGLLAAPETAGEVLVRQDAAWKQIVVLQPQRPTWLEVDLGAIAANTRHLARLAAPARLMAVLKADAYGHGAVQVAHTVLRHGASALAVACLSEGQALRAAGLDAPVLVLGYTPAWQALDAVGQDLTLAVFDMDSARAIARAGVDLGRSARVHVKVDVGMHRLGVALAEAFAFLAELTHLQGLVVEGLFTHLPRADETAAEARAECLAQLERFDYLVANLARNGLRPPQVHALNSAGLLAGLPGRHDLVRPGIALYGLAPAADLADPALRPALAWKTQVAQVRDIPPREPVGYGGRWRPARPSRIATIPVGYADGFRRAPATWRHVLVRGAAAPLVGRVSMDQSTIDVTDIPGVQQGDEVVLIGHQRDAQLPAETVADWLGTNHYEVVSAILARVPRVS
jgi:alanine racemase